MINVKDVLCDYRDKLQSYLDSNLSILDEWTDIIDDSKYDPLLSGEPYSHHDDHQNNEIAQQWTDFKALLMNKSLITKTGIAIVPEYHYHSLPEPEDWQIHQLIINNNVIVEYQHLAIGSDPAGSGKDYIDVNPVFNNAIGGFTSLDQMLSSGFESLSENVGINQVLLSAINLVDSGQLTVANFTSTCQGFISNCSGSVKNVYNTLLSSVAGVPAVAQPLAIAQQISNLVNGIKTASISNIGNLEKIDFSNTDWTINTSCFGALGQIASTATQLLGVALTVVAPIISLALNVVGSIVSSVVSAIDNFDNKSLNFQFNDKLSIEDENHLCVVPLFQYTIKYSKLLDFGDIVVDEDHPFCILKNGLYEVRVWSPDNTYRSSSTINIEGFLNFKASVFNADPYSGLLGCIKDSRPMHITQVTQLQGAYVPEWTKYNQVAFNAVKHAFDIAADPVSTNFMSQGNVVYNAEFTGDLEDDDHFRIYMKKLVYGVALTYLLASSKDDRSASPVGLSFDYNSKTFLTVVEKYGLDGLIAMLYMDEASLDTCTIAQMRHLVAEIVNTCIPQLRQYINDNCSESFTWTLFGDTSSGGDDGSVCGIVKYTTTAFDHVLYNSGTDAPFYPSNSLPCNNFFVCPPKSTVSIWWQLTVVAITVAAVVVTAAVVTTKIKRKLQYKAYLKRNALTARAEELKKQGTNASFEDWNALRKDTRKYNRFWGKLAGNTFDMNNAWVDYTTSSTLTDTGSNSSLLAPKIYQAITGNSL